MSGIAHRLPRYATVGLVLLLLMETALFCAQSAVLPNIDWAQITAWATPVCWWGYLLVIDAWLYRRNGTSWLTDRREMFVALCLFSIVFWALFEAYNRVMPGWEYHHLEPLLPLRFLGYALAFATIGPGLFLTTELLQSYRLFLGVRLPRIAWTPARLRLSQVIGAVFCFAPPFLPDQWRGYLWTFVWTGWFFLLEPVNYRRGAASLFRDWERGDWTRSFQLFLAGAICGLLWEFWNMWAYTKWVYLLPFGQNLKIFEMPLLGFLGFLPFALEYFALFHFVESFFTKEDTLGL